MDLALKVGIMVAAMVILYALARSFSKLDEADTYKPPADPPVQPRPAHDVEDEELAVRPRTVGDTTVKNYGFSTIDLRTGPPDPEDFYDELIAQFYSAETGHEWEATYTVCTPKGIASYMRDKGYASLLASGYVIVPRYDIDLILETILEPVEEVGDYTEPDQLADEPTSFRSGASGA